MNLNKSSSNKSTNSKLSDSRRTKMEMLRKREESKDRRQVLEQVLVKKLTKKYGQSDENFHKQIKLLVQKLIKGSGRITEADIAALELTVKNLSLEHPSKKTMRTPSSASFISSAKAKPDEPRTPTTTPVDAESNTTPLKGSNEWVLINALKAVEHEQTQVIGHTKKIVEKSKQRQWLDKQRDEKLQIIQRQKQQELELYKQQVEDLKKWQEEEELKEKLHMEEINHIKTVRDQQLHDLKVRNEKASLQKKLEEEKEVERCQRLLREEEEEANRKRVEERERMHKVLLENQRVELVKQQRKKEEQEYDIKLMEEYAQKLAKEEQDRIDALNSKLRRQDEIHSGIAMSTHELILKKAKEDEQRAEEYQHKKMMEDKMRDENDRKRRQQEEIDRKHYLDYQRSLKEKKQKEDYESEQEFAVRFRREGEEAQREQKEQKERIRQQNKKYEKELLNQMREQQEFKKKQFAAMDPNERLLNAKLLEKLDQDDALRDQVVKRLSPQKQAASHSSNTTKSNIF